MKRLHILYLLISLALFTGCAKEKSTHNSFYYWKTTFSLTDEDLKLLDTLKIEKIYLRCFDLDFDPAKNQLFPLAPISFKSKIPKDIAIIPVIFITNKAILQLKEEEIPSLCNHLINYTDTLLTRENIIYNEFQVDCDWTTTSREIYFKLISQLKKDLHQRNKTVSVTLRLHQIKYKKKTGIPPADRGMLMYYNMGKLEASATVNSIFDKQTALSYVSYIHDYPLPMDVALPIFTWGVHIRRGKVLDLLNNWSLKQTQKHPGFKDFKPGFFLADTGFFFNGIYFQKYDQLRIEEINPTLSYEAAQSVAPEFENKSNFNVILFHLDSSNTSRYEISDFTKIYAAFK